jgi:hypothetical protein
MFALCTFDDVRVEVSKKVALEKMGFITLLFQDSDQPSDGVSLNHPSCTGEIVQEIVNYLVLHEEHAQVDQSRTTKWISDLGDGEIIQIVLAADFLDVHDLLETMAKSRKAVLTAIAEQSTIALQCLLERGAILNQPEAVFTIHAYVGMRSPCDMLFNLASLSVAGRAPSPALRSTTGPPRCHHRAP